ncbi:MAG: 5'/3'-nucleotidase SurE [Thermoanaerobaculia bacterium]|nr:5'/3'-nucleotidase SurE [Thermoanaerobaculia bacterium]
MRILATNDDGIFSEGLRELAEALAPLGQVVVVAPDREQSATGHSLTLDRPLRMRKVREHWYAVDGTPTDCVNLAVHGLLKEAPPDLVVSGINFGGNLGDDVTYSGTVSAAFEANLHQLPAVAFSQEIAEGFSFAAAAAFAHELIAELIDCRFPTDLLLNVNLPAAPIQGVRFTHLGRRHYRQTVIEKLDPKGRKYFWIAGTPEWENAPGTDHEAISKGYVSVTPLHLDLTDYRGLEAGGELHRRLSQLGARPRGETDGG